MSGRGRHKFRSFAAAMVVILAFSATSGLEHDLLFSYITTLTGDLVSSGAIPMVDLALEQINNHSSILPGYRLGYTSILDSQCNHMHALEAYFQHFQNTSQPTYITSFCCGCSIATEPIAEISHFWNIPQMSFSSGAHILNNRELFPGFFRTIPSFEHLAQALVTYMEEFNWTQLAVITQSERSFIGITEQLESLFAQRQTWRMNEVTIRSDLEEGFPYGSLFDYDDKEDYRIVFINTYERYAARVLCEAFHVGMGSDRVWITHGFYEDLWWLRTGNMSCTDDIMQSMVNRSFAIIPDGFLLKANSDQPTISGLTEESFHKEYVERLSRTTYSSLGLRMASDAGLAFDATWAVAIGLDNARKRIESGNDTGCEDLNGTLVALENFDYTNHKMGCVLRTGFAETSFEGMTGKIVYSHNGSRLDNKVDLEQYRLENGDSDRLKTVASVTVIPMMTWFQFADDESVHTLWPEDGVPPYDGAFRTVIHLNSLWLQIICSILASFGLCYSVACLVFNLVFRNRRIVKLSSPNLNYLIITGAMLMYSCVYLYVFDSEVAYVENILCNMRQWVLSIGYSLCFGVVLAKTWRVYYIFNKPSFKKNKKLIKDWMLFLIVFAIVLVDVVITLVGSAIPQSRLNATLVKDEEHGVHVTDMGINEDRIIYMCIANAIAWLAVSFAYKGLLQILAMFMAFHVRNVKIKALKDTVLIVAIVYINSIVLITMVVAFFVLPSYHNTYAALCSTALLVGATVFLSFIFIPKMISLYRDPKGENVFTGSLSSENGRALQVTKKDSNIKLAGFQTNVFPEPNESVSTLRARVTLLEEQLAEAEKKLKTMNADELSETQKM